MSFFKELANNIEADSESIVSQEPRIKKRGKGKIYNYILLIL